MKLTLRKIVIISLLSLFIAAGLFVTRSVASLTDNVTGWAWSSQINWTGLNNCLDLEDPSTCGPTGSSDFGLNAPQNAPGDISGYAWNASLGWITFNASEIGSCPSLAIYAPSYSKCSPYTVANGDGTYSVRGFARACNMYVSGCSGSLKDDTARGGWDGYIALGDTDITDGYNWGVQIDAAGKITGFAWGSDVGGWINFDGQIKETGPYVEIIPSADEVDPGDTVTLVVRAVYNLAAPTSCVADVGSASWNGSITTPTLIPATTNSYSNAASPNTSLPLNIDTTFKVKCTFADGQEGFDDATITIKTDPLSPGVVLTATDYLLDNAGDPSDLSVTATNFDSGPIRCIITPTVGNVPMSGVGSNYASVAAHTVNPIVDTTYTATCYDPTSASPAPNSTCTTGTFTECAYDQVTIRIDTTPPPPPPPGGDPECSDGIDNDGDGLIDHQSVTPVGETSDPGCSSVLDDDESDRKKPIYIEF